jgi:hypothetical protein
VRPNGCFVTSVLPWIGSRAKVTSLFSRVQTYGEGPVHLVKVHVDPRSSGVFTIEQEIVRANL